MDGCLFAEVVTERREREGGWSSVVTVGHAAEGGKTWVVGCGQLANGETREEGGGHIGHFNLPRVFLPSFLACLISPSFPISIGGRGSGRVRGRARFSQFPSKKRRDPFHFILVAWRGVWGPVGSECGAGDAFTPSHGS